MTVRVEWAPRHRALFRRFGAWRRGRKKDKFRRPWTVQATAGEHTRELEITGWRRALRARDGIAAGLRTGGAAAWPSLARRPWNT